MPPRVDITGKRFGRLVALRFTRRDTGRASMWLFQCDCGNQVEARAHNVSSGNTASCGCYQIEATVARCAFLPPGGVSTPTYTSWASMRARCASTSGIRAVDYSLRGITCCERWDSYLDFLADMGERPDGTTLDRIDNDKGYEPGNCRWATPTEQVTNRRTPDRVIRDRTELADRLGVTVSDLMQPGFRHPGVEDINDRMFVEEWREWAEDADRGDTVYGFVPVEAVVAWINAHGGVSP